MSGPALRALTWHRAIHETAHHEAESAYRLAKSIHASADTSEFPNVVEVFLEVIEARLLVHAQEEEDGLYQEWLSEDPALESVIADLKKDHQRLRDLAHQVEQAAISHDDASVLAAMKELLETAYAHAEHEEPVIQATAAAREQNP